MVTFFDENHARANGCIGQIKTHFFTCLSVSTVAALPVTLGTLSGDLSGELPFAAAWLLTDRFPAAHDCCNYWQCNQFLSA